jgi:hypothetical protein
VPPLYKFVEVSPVTDESLGHTVNEWVAQGWTFEGIRFITTEASRRPAMAFVTFVRDPDDGAKPSPKSSAGRSKRR